MLSDTKVADYGDIKEVIVGPEAFSGDVPTSDFALYLLGVMRPVTNGSGSLAHRTGVTICYPECGENIMLEVRPLEPMRVTMTREVLGVGFTLRKDFTLFPFLRDGERITLRVKKGSEVIDMHARGPVSRAPEPLHQVIGSLRCALKTHLEQLES